MDHLILLLMFGLLIIQMKLNKSCSFFLPAAAPGGLGTTAAAPSHTIDVPPTSKDVKEVEAKQGQVKLALFNIEAMLDFEATIISNVQYGINPASMENIYSDQRSACPGMLTNLMNAAFTQARKQNDTSIFSS